MWFVSDYFTDALYSVVIWTFIMDLVIYDAHLMNYHMAPLWSATLGQSYFMHLDYLVICCWIWATLLHPTIITPVGALNVWRYVWLFQGVVGYLPNSSLCYHTSLSFYIFYFLMSQPQFPFLTQYIRIILPSIDNTHISTVR